MILKKIYDAIEEFCQETHGSSDFGEDNYYVRGLGKNSYIPLSVLLKKVSDFRSEIDLQKMGFLLSSCDFLEDEKFDEWYRNQFNKKLLSKKRKDVFILELPSDQIILDHIQTVNKSYEVLRESNVINNGKNFPVQLGEWYAKAVFGLRQNRSSSQRGFDFYTHKGQYVEVIVHWSDRSSPKGVKLKKSLVELSDFCIVLYLSNNFMIRDILFLDSEFIARKFAVKGTTIFLKDKDVSSYFFSVSEKHYDKIVGLEYLKKFSTAGFLSKFQSI